MSRSLFCISRFTICSKHLMLRKLSTGVIGTVRGYSFVGPRARTKVVENTPHTDVSEWRIMNIGIKRRHGSSLVGGYRILPSSYRWLKRKLPESAIPYMELLRWDKPIGTWLLYWPCAWSVALASPPAALVNLPMLALFGAGAMFMRGAGCIINDLWDRRLDKLVDRTKNRPLASGKVTPSQALVLLMSQLSLSLGVLALFNNPFAIGLAFAITPLVALYPATKRFSNVPQLFLGLAFNWGAFLGFAAIHGYVDLPKLLPLYVVGILWTLLYDTIYALQDRKSDIKVGIKSTAIWLGDNNKVRKALRNFASLSTLGLSFVGYVNGLAWPYYVGVLAAAIHGQWQARNLVIESSADCEAKFKSNHIWGFIVFLSIVFGKFFLEYKYDEGHFGGLDEWGLGDSWIIRKIWSKKEEEEESYINSYTILEK